MYTYEGRVIEIVEPTLFKVDVDLGFFNHSIQFIYLSNISLPKYSKGGNELENKHAQLTNQFLKEVLLDRKVILRTQRETTTRRSASIPRPIYQGTFSIVVDADHPLHHKEDNTIYKVSLEKLLYTRNHVTRDYTSNFPVLHSILNAMEENLFKPIDPKDKGIM